MNLKHYYSLIVSEFDDEMIELRCRSGKLNWLVAILHIDQLPDDITRELRKNGREQETNIILELDKGELR